MADPRPIQQRIDVDADDAKRELGAFTAGTRDLKRATQEGASTADEAGQTQRQSARAMREAGDATDQAAQKQGLLTRVTQGAIGSIRSMVGGMVGVGGLVAAYQAARDAADEYIQRLERIVSLQNEAAQSTIDLHAINQAYSAGDEDLVTAFSVATGRDFTESARTITQFRSANAALDRDTQNRLINESLLPLALSTGGDIDPLAKFIGRSAVTTTDPREINNLVLESIALAGEPNPSQFLGAAGELLVSGNAAGLENAETLGLLAFGSSKLETAQARTQLRNLFKKFSGDPKTRQSLQALGIDTSGDPLDILRRLGAAGVSSESIIELGGLENSDILQAITSEIGTVDRFVQSTQDAVGGEDLAQAFVRDLVGSSPAQARALQLAQQQQALEAVERGDPSAQVFAVARKAIEIELEKAVQAGDLPESAKNSRLETFDQLFAGRNFPRRVRGGLGSNGIALTERQRRILGGRDPINLPLDEITPEQIAESAAGVVEESGLLTDLLPGGNVSRFIELSDPVRDALKAGPALPGGNVTVNVNNGTQIRNAGDPQIDDLDGRDR